VGGGGWIRRVDILALRRKGLGAGASSLTLDLRFMIYDMLDLTMRS